jgi:hypothetical protein
MYVYIYIYTYTGFSGDQIEKNETGGACKTYGGGEMYIWCGVGGET